MTTIARAERKAVGSEAGVASYVARTLGGSEEEVVQALERNRHAWKINVEECASATETPMTEIEQYWPRVFQVFVENYTPESRPSASRNEAAWKPLQVWELTKNRGMWVTATLLRDPMMRFTAEYLHSMEKAVSEAGNHRPALLTHRAAARLLMTDSLWEKIPHIWERPYEITELIAAAERGLRSALRRDKTIRRRLDSDREDQQNLYGLLLRHTDEQLS